MVMRGEPSGESDEKHRGCFEEEKLSTKRKIAFAAAVGFALVGTAACGGGSGDSGGSGGSGGEDAPQIALLLPESATARYETHDRPNFEAKVQELCAECEVLYSNADQDAAAQQQQVEAAITNGADVLVLDPVNATAAANMVTRAKQSDIPVISYDRLISDADLDYYISFDNERVGELQGEWITEELGGEGEIVMINGAPTDSNAALFKSGAHSVIDESNIEVVQEYDTPDWSPDNAQRQMEQSITAIGRDNIDGVYAANDGTAGGAIAAMTSAGLDEIPPVTGQDAELEAIQRILAGRQGMTVYKAVKEEAETAAEMAVALARGEEPDVETTPMDNGQEEVPSVLLDPIVVTTENIQDTIIADDYWAAEDICTADYADACQEAGLQ